MSRAAVEYVYRRCSRCHKRVLRGTKLCECGHPRVSWYFSCRIPTTDGGRTVTRRGGFITRAAAVDAREKLLREVSDRTFVVTHLLTVASFVDKEWLPTVRRTLAGTTRQEYGRKLRLHALPRIGSVRLQQLQVRQLNALYQDLLDHGRADGRGALSPKSVREVHAVLHKAFGDAVRWGLLAKNPADGATPPSLRQATADSRRDRPVWTAKQLHEFLTRVEHDALYQLWLLAAMTGMRRSEVLGAPWHAVSDDARRIAVVQRLASVNGLPELSVPKTARSIRTIDLDARTASVLQQLRDRLSHEGRSPTGSDLVCAPPGRRWVHPDWFSEQFRRAVAVAGVPPIPLKNLRHTHATLLLQAGVNPKIVSERLGHHSVAFTLDVYAQALPNMQEAAAEAASLLVFGSEGFNSPLHTASRACLS